MFWKKKKIEEKKPDYTEMIFVDGKYDPYIDETCPGCGTKPVWVGMSCHTYEMHGRWVSCMDCGSAGWLYCENEECHWNYEWGLNPNNPRAEANERSRPTWLVGKWPF